MSVKIHGEETIREHLADGLTYRVIKISRTEYPSIRHESADLDGKPDNKYMSTVTNSDTDHEYSYQVRPYREALAWFKDNVIHSE